MARIQQLAPEVVAQVKAGEVIERPASVVKELLENSVDAGSTRIDVEVQQGGIELIRVVDNGCGMDADDLPLALTSHATSKLKSAEELFHIGTLGFRGEGLASIGGVTQVTLQSRPQELPCGAEIRCHGGQLSPVRVWNGAPGTRAEIRHLFFNTPVRRKFLRSPSTEFAQVSETFMRLALSQLSLHLTLRHNGKLIYEVPTSAGLLDRIGMFFGQDVRKNLYMLQAEQGQATLAGYIGDPVCDRGTAELQYFFVNGRWVRDRGLSQALQEGYRGLLMTGRHAVAFLFLEIPPEEVDVNVHPTKAEVRFRRTEKLHGFVFGTIRDRLQGEDLTAPLQPPPTPDSTFPPNESTQNTFSFAAPHTTGPREGLATPHPPGSATQPAQGNTQEPRVPASNPGHQPNAQELPQPSPPPSVPSTPSGRTSPPPAAPRQSKGSLPFVPAAERRTPPATGQLRQEPPPQSTAPTPREERGQSVVEATVHARTTQAHQRSSEGSGTVKALQVHDLYLLVEVPEGVLVIDQHALHERILYEQLRERIQQGDLEIQHLLIPEPINLSANQAALVLEQRKALRELGFEVSDFGGGTVLLQSYPSLLNKRPAQEVFRGVVDYLVTSDRPPSQELLLGELLSVTACHAAVRAGDRLTSAEIATLVGLRHLAQDSHHCPHGRPTSLVFTRQELDRQFRRT